MKKPIIGITCGDLNGIGLELIIKVFSDSRMSEVCTAVLFASNKAINYYRKSMEEYPLIFNAIKNFDSLNQKQLNVYTCWNDEVNITPGVLNDTGGKYAVRSFEVAVQCLKDGQIDALVTAPIHKKNTHNNNFKYSGHTPYLRAQFNAPEAVMMLYDRDFRMALITEHVPVTEVSKNITSKIIVNKTQIINDALVRDFGIDKPKIAILGLNPHAGDEGLIGDEEVNEILPAIELLKQKGILAFGPYSADGFFARSLYTKFDCTIAMYHDQGLIPFKSLATGNGVNYTCGLDIVRTSPDHGVGLDIAGSGVASADSMRESIFQAIDRLNHRKRYDEMTSNPLPKKALSKERF